MELAKGSEPNGSQTKICRGTYRDHVSICQYNVRFTYPSSPQTTRLTITTSDAIELVTELEFVWNQIKHNTPSSTDSSPKAAGSSKAPRTFQQPLSGSEGPMKILSPMSEQDEAEARSQRLMDLDDALEESRDQRSSRWQKKVERAVTKLSAEVAALREQITTGREWRSKKDRSFPVWFGWMLWVFLKHLVVDCVILAIVLIWMRRRKDRRLEDLVRSALKLMREYVRKVLPSR